MNTALVIIGCFIALVVVAAIAEAYIKRNRKKPLSYYAVNTRRWDDPANDPGNRHTEIEHTFRDSRSETLHKHWQVARDPEKYAEAMMPAKPRKHDDD